MFILFQLEHSFYNFKRCNDAALTITIMADTICYTLSSKHSESLKNFTYFSIEKIQVNHISHEQLKKRREIHREIDFYV